MTDELSVDWKKFSKTLAMLASDKDGDVLAAARALGRLLKAGGSDWSTLVAVISRWDGLSMPKAPLKDAKVTMYPMTLRDRIALDYLSKNINRVRNDLDRAFIRAMLDIWNKRGGMITQRQRSHLHQLTKRVLDQVGRAKFTFMFT